MTMAMDGQHVGRTVPHDLEAEAAVLGAILIDNMALHEVMSVLTAEHFYLPGHQVVFQAMVELQKDASPIDIVLLRNMLEERGALDRAGGLEALMRLAATVPSAANVNHYAKIVRDKGLARNLIRTCSEVIERSFSWEGPTHELVDEAEAKIFKLAEHGSEREAMGLAQILTEETWPLIDSLHDDNRPNVGCPTGFHELDDMLSGGFHPGELIIVAARPSMGKTSFALNCALNVATQENRGVAVFSLEVSRLQVAMNLLCMDSRIDVSSIRKGMLSDAQIREAHQGSERLAKLPVYILDEASVGIYTLRARARRLKHAHPDLSMILVDYLQLMEGSGSAKGSENRQQEISEISRGLKGLARELGVPVIALSQLNRSVDQREGHKPRMSDLRESGAIEQDADVVLFLYREEYYNKASPKAGLAEVIIGKQRNGPTGDVELRFAGQHMRFDNLSYRDPLDDI